MTNLLNRLRFWLDRLSESHETLKTFTHFNELNNVVVLLEKGYDLRLDNVDEILKNYDCVDDVPVKDDFTGLDVIPGFMYVKCLEIEADGSKDEPNFIEWWDWISTNRIKNFGRVDSKNHYQWTRIEYFDKDESGNFISLLLCHDEDRIASAIMSASVQNINNHY